MIEGYVLGRKALTRFIPKMIKMASSGALVEALENNLEETREHVSRAEQVFENVGKKPPVKNARL